MMGGAATNNTYLLLLAMMAFVVGVNCHCQVPCGIYDDSARINAMLEDVTTIRKASAAIVDISTATTDALQLNQLIRWVTTKEDHASRIIETLSTYFLTQKLKPVVDATCSDDACDGGARAAYLSALEVHHTAMRAAMTTKQGVDAKNVDALEEAIRAVALVWNVNLDHDHHHHH